METHCYDRLNFPIKFNYDVIRKNSAYDISKSVMLTYHIADII